MSATLKHHHHHRQRGRLAATWILVHVYATLLSPLLTSAQYSSELGSTALPESIAFMDGVSRSSSVIAHTDDNNFARNGDLGTIVVRGVLGANITDQNVVRGQLVCSPIIYPGGYILSATFLINTGNVAGLKADAPFTTNFQQMSSRSTVSDRSLREYLMTSSNPFQAPSSVGSYYGGVLCVTYAGEKAVPITFMVSASPSPTGYALVLLYVSVVVSISVHLATRVFSPYNDSPTEGGIRSIMTAPYFPGLEIPPKYQRIAALAAFLGGALVSAVPHSKGPYGPGATAMWPLPEDQDAFHHPNFMPLPVWPIFVCIPAAVLAQFVLGILCAYAARLSGTCACGYEDSVPDSLCVFIVVSTAAVTAALMPGGTDYRMQALCTRTFIVFGFQMAIWMFGVRPLLSAYPAMTTSSGSYETA